MASRTICKNLLNAARVSDPRKPFRNSAKNRHIYETSQTTSPQKSEQLSSTKECNAM